MSQRSANRSDQINLGELVPGQRYYVTFQQGAGPRREMVAAYAGHENRQTKWSLQPTAGNQIINADELLKVSGPTGRPIMRARRLGD
jgi:hypothetical protein